MAGKVVVSTLNNDTGVLATQNGMTGIAKAWVNFNGTTASPSTIRDSFNVTSITKNSTGDYTINFTTAMPNANYCAVVNGVWAYSTTSIISATGTTYSTTQCQITVTNSGGGTNFDLSRVCVAVFSS